MKMSIVVFKNNVINTCTISVARSARNQPPEDLRSAQHTRVA